MNRSWMNALCAVALIPAAIVACNRDRGEREIAMETGDVERTGDTMVVVDRFVVALPERENVLERIRDSYRRHEMRETAEHLRHAAARLLAEEQVAPAGARAALASSIGELAQLATQIERGARVKDDVLDHALARAHLALEETRSAVARERRVQAMQREQLQQVNWQIAEALDGAAGHLERAAALVDRRRDNAIQSAVRETHELAKELRHGKAVASDAVDRAWTQLGSEASRLRSEIGMR